MGEGEGEGESISVILSVVTHGLGSRCEEWRFEAHLKTCAALLGQLRKRT